MFNLNFNDNHMYYEIDKNTAWTSCSANKKKGNKKQRDVIIPATHLFITSKMGLAPVFMNASELVTLKK